MKSMAERQGIPYNIQFFAEEQKADAKEEAPDTKEQKEEQDAPKAEQGKAEASFETLATELASTKAEMAKMKAALDKALSKNGELTKALREKQSAQEIADAAAAEEQEAHRAYVAGLEEFKSHTLAKDRYLMQGMDQEMALKAADAEIAGDMDKLADIQRQHTESIVKAREAVWKKSRPQVNTGNGVYSGMTRQEIMAIRDTVERQKAIAANMELFQ